MGDGQIQARSPGVVQCVGHTFPQSHHQQVCRMVILRHHTVDLHIDTNVENGRFAAWITRIAHNLIIDFFRQEKSENLQSCDLEDVDILNRKELSEETIEDSIITRQIHADIRRIVKALPESQQEVLVMRFYKNMSFKEIADATNVSINTALGRMRYAILNMRRIAEENNILLTAM